MCLNSTWLERKPKALSLNSTCLYANVTAETQTHSWSQITFCLLALDVEVNFVFTFLYLFIFFYYYLLGSGIFVSFVFWSGLDGENFLVVYMILRDRLLLKCNENYSTRAKLFFSNVSFSSTLAVSSSKTENDILFSRFFKFISYNEFPFRYFVV